MCYEHRTSSRATDRISAPVASAIVAGLIAADAARAPVRPRLVAPSAAAVLADFDAAREAEAQNEFLAAALDYAARGWRVLPCQPRGKAPLVKGGCHAGTVDPEVIRGWWRRWPTANVAVATGGASDLIVLDVDAGRDGYEALALLEQGQPLPNTVVFRTGGGGEHWLFRHPGGYIGNTVDHPRDGLDFRGDGGYIIAPPSVHPSGGRYAIDVDHHPDDVPVAALPDWLLALLRPPETPPQPVARDTSSWLGLLENVIPEGRRNASIAKVAGLLFRRCYCDPAVIAAIVHCVNEARCRPPLPAEDVDRIAQSIARREAQRRASRDGGNR